MATMNPQGIMDEAKIVQVAKTLVNHQDGSGASIPALCSYFNLSPNTVRSILAHNNFKPHDGDDDNWEYIPYNQRAALQSAYSHYSSMLGSPLTYGPPLSSGRKRKAKKVAVKKTVKKEPPKITLDSVVIDKGKKDEIRAAIAQIRNHALIFTEWGFDEVFEKGTAISMLFWGIPGTGKTLMAQAISDEVGADLKIISTAEIETSEPGGAERAIKSVFREVNKVNKSEAKDVKKKILLFDECDSLLSDRNEVGTILAAQINVLLSEIEHYEGIIIFTTNRLGKLDPALERRITAKIEFSFPDKEARKLIWKRMIPKKAPLDKDVKIEELAEFPLVGGNIKNAVLNAARAASYRKLPKINKQCFVDAIEKEVESIQAFVAEYEKQDHTRLANHLARTSTGVSVERKQVSTTKALQSLWGQKMKGDQNGK